MVLFWKKAFAFEMHIEVRPADTAQIRLIWFKELSVASKKYCNTDFHNVKLGNTPSGTYVKNHLLQAHASQFAACPALGIARFFWKVELHCDGI